MAPPFEVMRGDRVGAEPIYETDDLEAALRHRDSEAGPTDRRRVTFFVVDADDPERGSAEWCDGCGTPTFGLQCQECG